MSLVYACEISARLGKYNFIYGDFSKNWSVLYNLSCIDDCVEMMDEFEEVLFMKVVDYY